MIIDYDLPLEESCSVFSLKWQCLKLITLTSNQQKEYICIIAKNLSLKIKHKKNQIIQLGRSIIFGIRYTFPQGKCKNLCLQRQLSLIIGQQFNARSCFGQYKIVKQIGEGGFGSVLLGEHRLSKQKVAIKIIKPQMLSKKQLQASTGDIDNLFVQVQILKTLKHDNIVKVINCFTLAKMQFIIMMEYLEGGQLLSFVQKKGKLNQQQAKFIFKQIIKAINHCHDINLIHRDMKLQNVLLVCPNQMHVKVVDFGIAGMAGNFTIESMDTGSLKYMAPQLFAPINQRKIDTAVDIWSCGVILFAMLTGYLPFKGHNNQQIIENILECNYNIPNNLNLSNACKDVIIKCFEKQPKKRIKSSELLNHIWLNENFLPLQKLIIRMTQKNGTTQKIVQVKEIKENTKKQKQKSKPKTNIKKKK